MRADARAIFDAGVAAADPRMAVLRHCRREGSHIIIGSTPYDLDRVERLWVVGAGKATAAMAQAIEELLGDRIHGGLISVKYDHARPLEFIHTVEAGHPLPDANGESAARRIVAMANAADADDLVIVLLSGGGSALWPLPTPPLTLAHKQAVSDLLLRCGATIHQINVVRKRLSAIKGGALARAAFPARVVTLAISDVVGDDPETIASGPTVVDSSTCGDALGILSHYRLLDKIPPVVRDVLETGSRSESAAKLTPDRLDKGRLQYLIVADNGAALAAARREAACRGYATRLLSSHIQGFAETVAQNHAAKALEILGSGNPIPPPACLLSGGETTVTLRGDGRGGRNQQFALAAASTIADRPYIVLLSAGTDGTDGPTDAAGALVDHTTQRRARAAGLDIARSLARNDAYPFFKRLGDLIKTGPTGTNVMDLHVVLVSSPVLSGKSNACDQKDIP